MLLEVVIVAAVVSYVASTYILRDYWSALNSAVCGLLVAITIVERRCRKWCKREPAKQVD
jgi:hypothetical protein